MLHPQGIHTLLITNVEYRTSVNDNKMYVITLTDDMQKYSCIYDYLMLSKTSKDKFSVISGTKAKDLLRVCKSKDIKEVVGCYVKANIAYRHDKGRFLAAIAEYLDTEEQAIKKAAPIKTDVKSYSLEKIRETHKQAYLPWTEETDNKLKSLFSEGKSVKELAQIFERNEGAIQSRLKKLNLT